ncbi:hypothetical protein LB456_13200 [Psychroflexus sp. CAK57W]|uniref:hypothetical protein n=1 Tax=Psychroflexus curvus TaxID=2873595 RepID=UPI001CCBF333|nr:hypothetical protein [Psychroflexus curvus]MBZ9628378.1 hypothetical protein [Psychroflexus curvus]MBZ9788417.1 hypothetical protein [Psychroflexus curvus]
MTFGSQCVSAFENPDAAADLNFGLNQINEVAELQLQISKELNITDFDGMKV